MAAKELDKWTRAAERAEMQIRLQARIARLLEARARPARRLAAAGSGRPGAVRQSQAEARNTGFPPGPRRVIPSDNWLLCPACVP